MAASDESMTRWRFKLIWFAAFATVALLVSGISVKAQSIPTDLPVQFTADELNVDRELGIITARGRVEVNYEQRTLVADTISYNQNADVMTASGNVTLLEPSGDVIFADHMEISGDLKSGVISNIRIIMSDRSRIAANGGKRANGDLDLRKAVYSPCNLCADDPSAPPLWQIKAVKVYHDQSRRMVEYNDAWLEVAGVPVFYTPFLTHPDPTVRRESGFLTPDFGTTSDLGTFLKVPYFINIDEQSDATVTPVYYGDHGPAVESEYRHRLHSGTFDLAGSAVDDDGEGFRGHLDGEGEFILDDTWRWGFEGIAVSDDTYLRRYRFSHDGSTISNTLYTEGFRRRNYARVEALHFNGLQSGDDSDTTPLALPVVTFQHEGEPDKYGGQLLLGASMATLTRDDGADSYRLSINPGWRNSYTAPTGESYTLSLSLDGDAYFVNDHIPDGQTSDADSFSGRLFPQAKLDWRLPLVRQHETVHQVIEPLASLVVAPNGSNPTDIPNEDSLEVEFDETSLFRANRFAGNDRVESGSRIDYGMQWGVYGSGGGHTSVLIGQSLRLRDNSEFGEGTGLEDHFSDYVAKLEISPSSYLDIAYRTRIDNEDGSFQRNLVEMTAGVPLLKVRTAYRQIDAQEESEFGGREQISTTISSEFDRNWRGEINGLHDLAEGRTRNIGTSLTYEDECLVFTGSFTRSFFRDRDLQPNDTILFRISLKTLGDFETAAF